MTRQALDYAESELDVTTVLRRLRVLEGIAKETLDNDKWKALWNKYSIETLNEP